MFVKAGNSHIHFVPSTEFEKLRELFNKPEVVNGKLDWVEPEWLTLLTQCDGDCVIN